MHLHRSSALDVAAAALTVACTRVVAVPLSEHMARLSTVPRNHEKSGSQTTRCRYAAHEFDARPSGSDRVTTS